MLQKRATCQFNYKRVTNVERIAGHVLIDAKVELFEMYQDLLYLLRNQLSDTEEWVCQRDLSWFQLSPIPITAIIAAQSTFPVVVNISPMDRKSIDHTQIQMWKLCDMSAELFIDFSTEEGLVRY